MLVRLIANTFHFLIPFSEKGKYIQVQTAE